MRDLIESRMTELQSEFDAGRQLQQEMDARQEDLRRSLLRISGAIQALGELLSSADARDSAPPESDHAIPLRRVAEK